MHVEKINFKPTPNVEFGFERTVIWGGKGRPCISVSGGVTTEVTCDEPITLHTFLKSFFSVSDLTDAEKFSRDDPGARFASFDFSWRLPWLHHWLTLYADSMVHDDVSPVDAPRHAGVRPGLYLARVPGIARLDARFEGALTNVDSGPQLAWAVHVRRTGRTAGLYEQGIHHRGRDRTGVAGGAGVADVSSLADGDGAGFL